MSVELKLRRGTTAECTAMTPAEGEVVVDTTLDTIRIGDGATAGGHLIAKDADVVDGPGSATDNAIARFDGTTGKLIQDSAATVDDTGVGTFVGLVNSAQLTLSGVIAPAQLTGDVNDYAPAGFATASTIRLSSDASRAVTGLAGGASGIVKIILNVGAQNITFPDDSASSAAGNRFYTGGSTLTLAAKQGMAIVYDGTSSKWRVWAVLGSGGVSDGDKGDLTVSGGGTVYTIDNDAITTIKILDSAVTLPKLQEISGLTVLGNATSSDGAVAEITAGSDTTVLRRNGTALDFGTVDNAWIGASAAISLAKLQNIATDRLLGRTTAGSGAIEEIPVTDFVQTIFDDADAGTARGTLGFGTDMLRMNLCFYANIAAVLTMTDQAAAAQFLANSTRNITKTDLTYFTQARLITRVTTGSASGASPRLRLRYHTAFSTTIGDYVDAGTSEIACSLTTAGVIDSGWVDLAAGAKADIFLIVDAIGGDGAADPAIGPVYAEFRRR